MSDNNENNAQRNEKIDNLTDKQLRIYQFIAGIVCSAALVASLYIMPMVAEENSILQYAFLAVFLLIMFGRRRIETKYRLRLNLFGTVLLDGIVVGIIGYAVYMFYYAKQLVDGKEVVGLTTMSDTVKLLIVVGATLLFLGLGVALPLIRYKKRMEDGTLPPIRIPEKTEEEKQAEEQKVVSNSLEQRIAEMTRELDEKKDDTKENL
jgi:hypothetical protein